MYDWIIAYALVPTFLILLLLFVLYVAREPHLASEAEQSASADTSSAAKK